MYYVFVIKVKGYVWNDQKQTSLLKSESANWEDFARVKENDRQQLRKLIILSSEEDILEKSW